MSFEPFNREKHFPLINEWNGGHGLATDTDGSQYPDTGFVVDGILASWIYKTNSSIAYIDNTIADPKSDKAARREAQTEMLSLLMEEAAKQGAKTLCTLAYHESFDEALRAQQFITLPNKYYVYVRSL